MIDPKRLTETSYPIYEEAHNKFDRDTKIRFDKAVLKEYSDRGRPVDSAKLARIIQRYYL